MPLGSKDLYLDRRTSPREDFRRLVRFHRDPSYPLRHLERALSQNFSLRGIQVLSRIILEPAKTIEMWIPLEEDEVIRTRALVEWTEIEDQFTDSPYWLRVGLSLTYTSDGDRFRVARQLANRRPETPVTLDVAQNSKVSFVF